CVAAARSECAVQGDVPDAAPGDVELRQQPPVEAVRRRVDREDPAPDLGSLNLVGEWEVDDEPDPPEERGVQRRLLVCREYRKAAIRLHPLEEVADLDVGVAIVAVLDLAALAENRVGLVEEQDRAADLRCVEDSPQVLLRLADVLAHDL